MNIVMPRFIIVGMAALFSGYILVLATYSIKLSGNPGPVVAAMCLFLVAAIVSLLRFGPMRMPTWMAVFNLAVAVAISLLATIEVDPSRVSAPVDGAWHVAAIGILMTITSTRRRHALAWIGLALLAVQIVAWAGPAAIISLGLVRPIIWVGSAHILSKAMAAATKDAQQFAIAEREAADWEVSQEAHLHERQFQLHWESAMSLGMLRLIQEGKGNLTDVERQECRYLEAALRDEIRGRRLLNDAVRHEVMVARHRGATVTLFDEGGIDELRDEDLDRVLNRLALAIRETTADTVIARTVPGGSDIAVTVVGRRSVGHVSAAAVDHDSASDDKVELWLEIPRVSTTAN